MITTHGNSAHCDFNTKNCWDDRNRTRSKLYFPFSFLKVTLNFQEPASSESETSRRFNPQVCDTYRNKGNMTFAKIWKTVGRLRFLRNSIGLMQKYQFWSRKKGGGNQCKLLRQRDVSVLIKLYERPWTPKAAYTVSGWYTMYKVNCIVSSFSEKFISFSVSVSSSLLRHIKINVTAVLRRDGLLIRYLIWSCSLPLKMSFRTGCGR